MKMVSRKKLFVLMVVLLTISVASGILSAHEDRTYQGYDITVGFVEEPAFEGFPNGASIRVMKLQDRDGSSHVSDLATKGPDLATKGMDLVTKGMHLVIKN